MKKNLYKSKIYSKKFYSNLMYNLIKKLYPINRSLTGEGNRKSLNIIKSIIPLKLNYFSSGKKVFDWRVPLEWNIKNAYFQDLETKKKYAEFKKNNLHLVGYSVPMNKNMSFSKLKNKIYFDKKKINAIPYITSYYKKDWGFCLSKKELRKINGKKFKVFIDSKFSRGRMDYGELLIRGKSKKEILFSTYICHPSMINNELSGPAICTAIAHYLSLFKKKELNFSYRFIFVPETIGSIAYIHKNYKNLKKNVIAGFVINCAGDNRSYSFVHSPDKNTLADDMMIASLKNKKNKIIYEFKDRSSDERQYCSANVELPICSFSRSKAGSKNFPEYHTNLDNFKVVTKSGLTGSLDIFKNIIFALEYIPYPKSKIKCEPFMTKRGMYPTLSRKDPLNGKIKNMLDILAYANGKRSIFYICNALKLDLKNCIKSLQDLIKHKLI